MFQDAAFLCLACYTPQRYILFDISGLSLNTLIQWMMPILCPLLQKAFPLSKPKLKLARCELYIKLWMLFKCVQDNLYTLHCLEKDWKVCQVSRKGSITKIFLYFLFWGCLTTQEVRTQFVTAKCTATQKNKEISNAGSIIHLHKLKKHFLLLPVLLLEHFLHFLSDEKLYLRQKM